MKIPESVLVVIYTPALDVLIIERADHPGFWQSITGSKATFDEPLRTTWCVRWPKKRALRCQRGSSRLGSQP